MPVSRTAKLLASTAVTFAVPVAAQAAVETCTAATGVVSETTDFGDTAGTATALPADTVLVCGDWDGVPFQNNFDLDFITFTDLNAGQSFFDVNYSYDWPDVGELFFGDGTDAGSIATSFVESTSGSGTGSFTVDTGESFAGGSYSLVFDMGIFFEGSTGSTSYSVRLREAEGPDINPVPLPASSLLLGAGLAGLGAAASRKKKAKRRS